MGRTGVDNYPADQKTAVKISLIYLLIGSLWILFSDLLLLGLGTSPHVLAILEIFKGWFYVFATTGLLYVLIKRGMRALQLSEERYRLLFEQANDAILVVDDQGHCVAANRQVEQMTGYSQAELLAISWPTLLTEESPEAIDAICQAFKSAGRHTGEQVVRRKDGQHVDVEYAAAPGAPGYFQLILRDLTKRKQAELELRRQALIFQYLTDAIIVTDLERRIIDWNPAAEKMFGYTKTEILGQPTENLHPTAANQLLGERIIAALTETGYWQGEITYAHRDGSIGVCETTVVPLFDERGVPIARIGVNRDLTERRQLEAQLRQAQKMEAIGRLAGGIAHDFNNLLTVINGNAEFLLARYPEPDSPIWRDLDQIIRAGNRAADLTKRLLAFSRQQVLQPQVLNLNQVVTDLEKMLRRLIGEDIELIITLAPGLIPVEVDPTQLEQIIMNLVVNARDAMPTGGRLTIETANVLLDETYTRQNIEFKPGRYVLLAVTDTGHGIAAEIQSKIFEPFFTTKGQDQGTGLGLSTVYGIVKQSGGHINVYSELSWGTTFKIYLPQTVEEAGSILPHPVQIQSLGGVETILLVEDETGVREFIEQLLTEYGYTVLAASRADEAVALGRKYAGRIKLLLTDVILPDLTGPDLAQQLADELFPELKVLYMSGYTDRTMGLDRVTGANRAFIQKPFSPDALARKLRELLDQAALSGG